MDNTYYLDQMALALTNEEDWKLKELLLQQQTTYGELTDEQADYVFDKANYFKSS